MDRAIYTLILLAGCVWMLAIATEPTTTATYQPPAADVIFYGGDD